MAISVHMPQPSRWSRKRKVMSAIAGVLTAFLIAFAVALLLTRGPLGGGGSVNDPPRLNLTNGTVVSETLANCTVADAANGQVNLQVNNAIGGASSCVFQVRAHVANAGAVGELRLQDVTFGPEGTTAVTLSAGDPLPDSAPPPTPGAGCGDVLNNGEAGTPSGGGPQGHNVRIHVSVPNGAPTGPFVAGGDAGLYAVPSAEYVPANCPAATP